MAQRGKNIRGVPYNQQKPDIDLPQTPDAPNIAPQASELHQDSPPPKLFGEVDKNVGSDARVKDTPPGGPNETQKWFGDTPVFMQEKAGDGPSNDTERMLEEIDDKLDRIMEELTEARDGDGDVAEL